MDTCIMKPYLFRAQTLIGHVGQFWNMFSILY